MAPRRTDRNLSGPRRARDRTGTTLTLALLLALLLAPTAGAIHQDDTSNLVDITSNPTELVFHAVIGELIDAIGEGFSAAAAGLESALTHAADGIAAGLQAFKIAAQKVTTRGLETVDTVLEAVDTTRRSVVDAIETAGDATGPAAPFVQTVLWVSIGVFVLQTLGIAIDTIVESSRVPNWLAGDT